ncbi:MULTISPECIES: AraC family transcriptional regulator [Paenibacillus]|uniref:helix-turn-helix domain-containing protein n=1 Tax=Paenibacillus TaxID=44249 RepID=UPI000A90A245|nr:MULTISPECIES: helix-turn-helix domain-containing protein [Paenibacillus]
MRSVPGEPDVVCHSSHVLDRRIALAKSCLSGGLSITEACYQSGFSDYANFIRSFTKTVGISPGRFAKS